EVMDADGDADEVADLEDRLLFDELVPAVEPPDDVIRTDLIDKVITSLCQDAERGEGLLARADVNRAYLKRRLSIAECAEVERALLARGIRIADEDAGNEVEEADGLQRFPQRNTSRMRFLSEAEERNLARKIQLATKLTVSKYNEDDDFRQRVMADAD